MSRTLDPQEIAQARAWRTEGMSLKEIALRLHIRKGEIVRVVKDLGGTSHRPLKSSGSNPIDRKVQKIRSALSYDRSHRDPPPVTLPRLSFLGN